MDSAYASSAGSELQQNDAGDICELFREVGIGLYQATPAGRFVRANPKLAQMLGWPSAEALIAEVEDIGSQLYLERDFRAEMLAKLERSGDIQFVAPVRRRDGRTIWVSETIFVVRGPDGRPACFLGTLTDVTELIRTQEALLAAERSYRELFENAAQGIYRSDPEGRILSANLAFVRLLGYDNERDMLLDLNERGIVRYADPKRPLEFRQQIAVTGRLTNFDSELVRRGGERVWISENARIVRDRSGRVLWYEGAVQDITERKCAEAALRQVQEAAAQLENDERDSSRGHGLGLANVKGLARVPGHRVSVRSTVGRGTVFSVTLPAADDAHATFGAGAAPVPAETPEPAAAGPRRSVLVIEDEPAQRMSLSLLLEDWGYLVRSAADLTSALQELEQWGEQPSFVVSDFRLPGGFNGVEAIREIGRQMGRRVPGIILTGDTDPARVREARQSGCILMHKPVSLGSLKHAVASLSGAGDRC